MKRFVRTFYVRRHAQFSVVDDGEARVVEVHRWLAGDDKVDVVASRGYGPTPEDRTAARQEVVGVASRMASDYVIASSVGRTGTLYLGAGKLN